MSGHVVPVRTYVLIFLALMVGTALTVGAAFVDLGRLNTVVALAIAVCKMLLVILFFMHVRHSSQLMKIVVASGFLWLVILISITVSDYLTRSWIPDPEGWGPSTAITLPSQQSSTAKTAVVAEAPASAAAQ
ncbi:MAG: cytochrome C oxidase subunit IV family protein [Acidobacteria bacterium]|nr:cytochrome C oxidase subunit IV family protein [Acidobacteriota bacterium]